jgi:hypothetical protein
VVSLRALIDELHLNGSTESELYEGMILKYFEVNSISELSEEQYKCLFDDLSILHFEILTPLYFTNVVICGV